MRTSPFGHASRGIAGTLSNATRAARGSWQAKRDGAAAPPELVERLAVCAAGSEYAAVVTLVQEALDQHGIAAMVAASRIVLRARDPLLTETKAARLFRITLREVSRLDAPAGLAFGEECLSQADTITARLDLAKAGQRAGRIKAPLALLEGQGDDPPEMVELRSRLRAEALLLRQGFAAQSPQGSRLAPAHPRRIMYVVSQSLPLHSSGYCVRTHYILRQLKALGYDVAGFARAGYPVDRFDYDGDGRIDEWSDVDGVRYCFMPDAVGSRQLDPRAYVAKAADVLVTQAKVFRPAVIHSASNYLVGLAGAVAARRIGVPCVYEMRGLWHMTQASKRPEYEHSDQYRLSHRLEASAAGLSDHALAITGAVRRSMILAGVDAGRISVLPNGVDMGGFTPLPRDPELTERHGLAGRVVFGFIGSFAAYEGLDDLVTAAAELRRDGDDRFRVLLVGDGEAMPELRAQVGALGLQNVVQLPGRVPHQDVARYYSVMDVCCYPRTPAEVCEFVSPLKPLEAMAMEKAVVASDVAALAEMVQHDVTGLLCRKGDAASLCDVLRHLLDEPALVRRLASAGRDWVQRERTWPQLLLPVAALYDRLASAAAEPERP
ncbi:glycosyltransferase [Thiohalocapsa sp. ML1]|uniref:glycosyltransferase n=1 Tax=Thiohalocapsa sp. ML1 TaxID=1431688 RepID=UPI0009E86D10|nr:glycosyltransferase [Thiohalocapsa sp. ML1]